MASLGEQCSSFKKSPLQFLCWVVNVCHNIYLQQSKRVQNYAAWLDPKEKSWNISAFTLSSESLQ